MRAAWRAMRLWNGHLKSRREEHNRAKSPAARFCFSAQMICLDAVKHDKTES